MADHYESFEATKTEFCEDELKKQSPIENFDLPRRRNERPFESRSYIRKPSIKKIENFEIISKLADSNNINSKKFLEGYSKRSFIDFSYTPSVFLTDYAQNKGEEPFVSSKFLQ
jgi:hypothetical protein